MKKLKIHYSVYFYLVAAIFSGIIKEVSLMFLVLVIHELGHLVVIRKYNYDINKITVLPFGAIIDCHLKNESLKKEFFLYAAGIIVNGLILIILCLFRNFGVLFYINLSMMIFNMLPIYPLDGGKLLETFCASISRYRLSMKILCFVSWFFLFIAIFIATKLLKSLNMLFLLSYLFISTTLYFQNIDKYYSLFILDKYLYPNKTLRIKNINRINLNYLYKGKNNISIANNKIVGEKELLKGKFESK